MTATPQRCVDPTCSGTIEDGYCNVCGTPGPAGAPGPVGAGGSAGPGRSAAQGQGTPTPSSVLGTGFVEGRPATAAERSGGPSSGTGSVRTGRTSSARLASTAIGSARTGSRTVRRVGTSSTRLRGARLGAGLTHVPPTPVTDPLSAVMADPQVPEEKRFCPSCGQPVGRARGDQPGRSEGFCPACGTRFDFRPQLSAGEVVGGQYEVVGALAHGGLGWIYLAKDRNVSDRWVVLKGLLNSGDPDAYAAAVAERQFLAEVEHPLIVEIYNFALHAGAGYIVMEYVGGRSLKQILKQRRDAAGGTISPLPVDQALAYVLEVLPAFAYLHDHGLVYCDFKPDNLVVEGESVKLIDLGGVRRVDDLESAIFGTVGYQAPEVAEVGPSVASDVYTIGRTLASLVLDFRGNTTTYVASLPPVADTPLFGRYDSFYRLLAKACALDPSDRFATVDELRGQLLGVLREVVAADGGLAASGATSAPSALFAVPAVDVAARPLAWDQLPALRVDEHDPMASWLAGVTVSEPAARVTALRAAPQQSVEVRLATAIAALAADDVPAAQEATAAILADDPWEWRGAWLGGLTEMVRGDLSAARAAFNAVYGQVPGELAPKLALATACEQSDEPDIAEQLYLTCAGADANYTPPAAFGLARLRGARGDVDGAVAALELVAPTRSSYPQARVLRARVLAGAGRGLASLADSLDGVNRLGLTTKDQAELRRTVLGVALAAVQEHGPQPEVRIGGAPATADALRDGLEQACRDLAREASSAPERIALVDEANRVRRWTWR